MNCLAIPVLAMLFAGPVKAGPMDDIAFKLAVRDEGRKSFYLALNSHYGVPDASIAFAVNKGIPDEEMPVVFFLAREAKLKPEVLIDLRLKGKSWADITLHLGLGAGIYYVPFKTMPGPPYGKAYGHFKNKPRSEWSRIVLLDADIVNFVNLKFMAGHHGFSADDVVKLRTKGDNFLSIHAYFKKKKEEAHKKKLLEKKKGHDASKKGESSKGSKGSKGGSGKKKK